MRSAARPAHSASSSAIASNMPVSRSRLGCATTAPRCGRASTRPEATSWRKASRTGVRDTEKRRAMSVSSSAAPGGSAPRTISSASCSRNSSARVILTTCGGARSMRRTTASAAAAAWRGDRRGSCCPLRRVDDADMRGDDPPTLGKAHPGLHLPSDLARQRVAIEQRRGDRHVAAIGGDRSCARSCASARPASAPRGTTRSRYSRRDSRRCHSAACAHPCGRARRARRRRCDTSAFS